MGQVLASVCYKQLTGRRKSIRVESPAGTRVRISGPGLELEETLVSFSYLIGEEAERENISFVKGLGMALESAWTGYSFGRLTETL